MQDVRRAAEAALWCLGERGHVEAQEEDLGHGDEAHVSDEQEAKRRTGNSVRRRQDQSSSQLGTRYVFMSFHKDDKVTFVFFVHGNMPHRHTTSPCLSVFCFHHHVFQTGRKKRKCSAGSMAYKTILSVVVDLCMQDSGHMHYPMRYWGTVCVCYPMRNRRVSLAPCETFSCT